MNSMEQAKENIHKNSILYFMKINHSLFDNNNELLNDDMLTIEEEKYLYHIKNCSDDIFYSECKYYWTCYDYAYIENGKIHRIPFHVYDRDDLVDRFKKRDIMLKFMRYIKSSNNNFGAKLFEIKYPSTINIDDKFDKEMRSEFCELYWSNPIHQFLKDRSI